VGKNACEPETPLALVVHMNLTPKEVDHVAVLARLGITPEERARFADQLSGVLEHFAALQALDTSGVSPTAQVQNLHNVMRDDVAQPSAPRDAILANAPRTEDGFFRVQAVLDT
jgi:aspartyl-tRNA(Asn)/glutamyl-tRNA(Gln) amidotransferase subunit C